MRQGDIEFYPLTEASQVIVDDEGTRLSEIIEDIHGGGGGGGDVTGVKGNSESTYRTGNVNLTPANIGAVPTSTTVNGHALTGNITISKSDVGLGNVNNTSDLNKPISTATQTALNAKVNKTDIATTSNLGLVMPDGTSITIDADGTIHSVGGGGGGGGGSQEVMPLLWTNPSPSSNFSAQTVSLDLSAYVYVVIVPKVLPSSTNMRTSVLLPKGKTTTCFELVGTSPMVFCGRDIAVSDTGVVFGNGSYNGSANNGYWIPMYIYGIPKQIGGAGAISYYQSQTTSVASNAEILRITDSSITTATIVLECTFANPSAISGDVSWTSYNGYISFIGTCTSATTANVTLADKTN